MFQQYVSLYYKAYYLCKLFYGIPNIYIDPSKKLFLTSPQNKISSGWDFLYTLIFHSLTYVQAYYTGLLLLGQIHVFATKEKSFALVAFAFTALFFLVSACRLFCRSMEQVAPKISLMNALFQYERQLESRLPQTISL